MNATHYVKCREKGSKGWTFLTSNGCSRLRIHAARFVNAEIAQAFIDANAADNPEWEFRVIAASGSTTKQPNAARKGDVVAIATEASVTYAHNTGRGTERWTTFRLAYVERAKRDGTVTRVRIAGTNYAQDVARMARASVKTISSDNQPKARKLADAAQWDTEWRSVEALRTAILNA